jgi:NAD+ synthase (glutamine-hydrolysing)
MQRVALAQKLGGTGKKHICIGVSGGLDSTLALLVSVLTVQFIDLPVANVHAFSLPAFGTTPRTRANARKLCRALGVSFREINIARTCQSHLKDLEHSGQEDTVFENVQARYRTEFLFNRANQLDAIVLGTSDLSEIALGWTTFVGDHLAHYQVNASVPKTLVRYLVQWVADEELNDTPARQVLHDIIATPPSPELKRPGADNISQKSEEVIGPLELADFFLYLFIRFNMRPGKILYLASKANRQGLFDRRYTLNDLHNWLDSFLLRFFDNQFKRTALPEGPKVGTVSLSPRGDWRMASEVELKLWLEDLESMYRQLTASSQ